jgi:hypothetical protein
VVSNTTSLHQEEPMTNTASPTPTRAARKPLIIPLRRADLYALVPAFFFGFAALILSDTVASDTHTSPFVFGLVILISGWVIYAALARAASAIRTLKGQGPIGETKSFLIGVAAVALMAGLIAHLIATIVPEAYGLAVAGEALAIVGLYIAKKVSAPPRFVDFELDTLSTLEAEQDGYATYAEPEFEKSLLTGPTNS